MMRSFAIVVLLVCSSGCAIQQEPALPKLPPANQADGVTHLRLLGSMLSNIFRAENRPVITQVDRRDIAEFELLEPNLLELPAGRRELVFMQYFGNTNLGIGPLAKRTAQATVDWVLPRDTVLVVKSEAQGMSVFFWLEDEATGRPVSRRFVGQIGYNMPKSTWKFVPRNRAVPIESAK